MSNQTLLKKIFIILILISIIFSLFNNSTSSQKLDNLAYVVAIGIEKGNIEKYKISFELSTVKSSSSDSASGGNSSENSSSGNSGSSSSSENNPAYTINSVECSSIDTGISLLNTYINKHVSLSHCKIIVISEDLAKEGTRSIIYNFVNKLEIRPDCNIIISQTPGEEFKDENKPTVKDVLSKYFDLSSNTEDDETGYSETVTLNKFYSYLEDPLRQPYCALGNVINANTPTTVSSENDIGIDKSIGSIENKDEDIVVELVGVTVFNDDKMVGKLSAIETICHLTLIDDLKQCTISIPSPFDENDNINLYVTENRAPKINVYIDKNNKTPFVKIDVKIIGRLLSFNNNEKTINQEIIHQMEAKASEYYTNEIYNYLSKTSKVFKSDISGIGTHASINFLTMQELEKYDWLNKYEKSIFQVNASVGLKSGYFLTNK